MRRGFALTLSMIVLVFFLTLILTVETQRISIEEQTRINHARMRAIASLLADIDSPALNYSIKKLAKRTLYDIDMQVINTRKYLDSGTAKDEFCKNFTEKFKGYLDSLKMRAIDTGLVLTYTGPDCSITLVDPFNASLSVNTTITLSGQGIYATKTLNRTLNFSIEGVYDPILYLESANENPSDQTYWVKRPIIRSSIPDKEVENLHSIADGVYGQGWVYGEVIDVGNAAKLKNEGRDGEWGTKILYVDATQPDQLIKWKDDLGKFAGVILYGPSGTSDEKRYSINLLGVDDRGAPCTSAYEVHSWKEDAPCINCGTYAELKKADPKDGCNVVELENELNRNFNNGRWVVDNEKIYVYVAGKPYDIKNYQKGENIPLSKPFIKISSPLSLSYVLINTGLTGNEFVPVHSGMKLLDVEVQRGAVLCGNYFATMKGPDIFSRLEGKIDKSDRYGIETFVIGQWAKNSYYSKLDNEYYRGKPGNKVRGMPGCIRPDMCSEKQYPESKMTIGRFRISTNRDKDYGMEELIQK